MKRGKISPYDKDYEMEEVPNNQAPRPEQLAVEHLKMIANVGLAAVRWENYCNIRRKPKGRFSMDHCLLMAGRSTTGFGLAGDLNEEAYGCMQKESGGTANVIKQQIETAPNRNLVQYFARLSDVEKMEDFIDLEFVESLVESGADINCTDLYGQSVLHEVARTWHVDVAKFLVIELGADVNVGDHWGRTPLHVAASVDYPEMCNYLIEAGAEREAKTAGEEQTPLFYAARNDAVSALKHLIANGCEYKTITDFKKRTPLAVAAELDRSETARFLLEMGAPADVRDDSGQPVLVPLIMKMAPVAKEALNQFHQKDRANRKQYFYLGRIDPTTPDEISTRKYNTVIQVIVSNLQYDLAMHSAIQRLIHVKWNNFAKWRAVGLLLFQFGYIVSWSVFGLSKDWTARYHYDLPNEAWRIVVFALAVILTLYQVIEEIIEYRGSKRRHEEWKKWRLQEIARDEAYCHPRWPEEKEYLEQEKDELDGMAPQYFSDAWNFFDWTCYALLLVCIITHVIDVAGHNLIIARWHIRIMAVTVIILWLRFMKVVRTFSFLGPFIVILGHMINDVVKFAFVYLNFFVPFACAFWMIFGGDNLRETEITYAAVTPNTTRIQVKGLNTVYDMCFVLFRLTLVDDYDYDNMIIVDHVMAQILVGIWLALSAILCVNLFIALLSDTFQRVYDNAQANAVMQKAMTILNIMESLTRARRANFHNFLTKECNPESLYYDDDTSYGGEDDVKKATIEVREIVTELNEKFESVFGHHFDADDPLTDQLQENLSARPKRSIERVRRASMKNLLQNAPIQATLPTQMMKNMNVVSIETFEREIDSLRDHLRDLRDQQNALNETVRNDMAGMKAILQDIAVVITGPSSERQFPSGQIRPIESVYDVPGDEESARKKKKKKGRPSESVEEPRGARSLVVAPASPPMQIETYSPSEGYLPPITFRGPPRNDDEDV